MDEELKLYILLSIFVSAILMANVIAGVKLVNLAGFVMPAGFIAYCVTFPVTDIVDEVYGRRKAAWFVWAGFIANIVSLVLIYTAYLMPPLKSEMQKLYSRALMPFWRIVTASMIAYLVSQHHDVWAFWKWKEITKGKYLWLRNNASTMVSQAIDTILFISIAFYGVVPTNILLQMILWQWLWKVFVAVCDTPFVYLGVRLCKIGEASMETRVLGGIKWASRKST